MKLNILLPFQVFREEADVVRMVAETVTGSFGILPQRLDCVAALTPGILEYETINDGEVFVAVDEGILIKAGSEVLVSVRRALGGTDLEHLHAIITEEYLKADDRDAEVRSAMATLEAGFLRRLVDFHHA